MSKMKGSSDWGAIYGLGIIGAAIYFIQQASGALEIIVGLVKAVVWPAVVVHRALDLLNL